MYVVIRDWDRGSGGDRLVFSLPLLFHFDHNKCVSPLKKEKKDPALTC